MTTKSVRSGSAFSRRGRLLASAVVASVLVIAVSAMWPTSALADPATANLANWQQVCHNCYNYAKNEKTVFFNQPGGGVPVPITCAKVCARAAADGLTNAAWMPGQPPPTCPTGQCLVAKAVRPDGRDYHWWRRNADGTWSHKPGQTPATDKDASGNGITDPATADRGAYTTFCGFMCYDPANPPARAGVGNWEPAPTAARVYSLERTGMADPVIDLQGAAVTELLTHLPTGSPVPAPDWPDPTQAAFVGFAVVGGAQQPALPDYLRVFNGVVAIYSDLTGEQIDYVADDQGLETFLASQFALTQFLRIENGVVGDGRFDVASDGYGSWSQPFAGGQGPNDDHFNPPGTPASLQVGFTSGFYVFVGNTQRELLSDSTDWQTMVPPVAPPPPFQDDTTLDRTVTRSLRGSQNNDGGYYDTLDSSFAVTGSGVNLQFDLYQTASAPTANVGLLTQHYTITNADPAPITFKLSRAFDGDIIWDTNFSNDWVGTATSTALGHPHVFQQDPNQPTRSIAIASDLAPDAYFGAKRGVTPPNGPPAFGFGTDVHLWDAYGIPSSWVNFVAGVGYDTPGNSGSTAGCTVQPCDAFMGLEFNITLNPGESTNLTLYFFYGTIDVVLEPPPPVLVDIASANPPLDNPFVAGTQPFRDVLQTGTTASVTQGIGAAGTPAQDSITYAPISVTFSGTPSPAPTAANVTIACTGGTCPTVTGVTGTGSGPYAVSLSGAIPPGHCTTLTFPGTAAGQKLQYQYLPGDVSENGTSSATDVLTLVTAINNGMANLPSNLARYNVNRQATVTATDVLREVGLLNGLSTPQAWLGVVGAACP